MIRAAACALVLAGCTTAPAPQSNAAPAAPCSGAEYRQMDFWLGAWDASWDATAGSPAGTGSNTISKTHGDCVIRGGFSGGGLNGRSLSMYDAASGQWRQSWVDDQGGYFALAGGFVGDRFILENTRLDDDDPHLRIVFEDIRADAITWRWQRSADAGESWSDLWVIAYTRRAE